MCLQYAPLELLQLGLPSGDTLANDTIILGDRIGMDTDLVGRSGRGLR